MIMFTGSYNPIGKYFLCPILSYAPGDHWRWEVALPIYGSCGRQQYGAVSTRTAYCSESAMNFNLY